MDSSGALEGSSPLPPRGVNPANFIIPPVEGIAGGGTGYGWADVGTESSNLCKGVNVIDPTQIPSAELLHVWCMPSTANVGQQEMPRPFDHDGFGAIGDAYSSYGHRAVPSPDCSRERGAII